MQDLPDRLHGGEQRQSLHPPASRRHAFLGPPQRPVRKEQVAEVLVGRIEAQDLAGRSGRGRRRLADGRRDARHRPEPPEPPEHVVRHPQQRGCVLPVSHDQPLEDVLEQADRLVHLRLNVVAVEVVRHQDARAPVPRDDPCGGYSAQLPERERDEAPPDRLEREVRPAERATELLFRYRRVLRTQPGLHGHMDEEPVLELT